MAEKAVSKMVEIELFKDDNTYKDDVFVSVNGENYQIQRGVPVAVPDYVAEVLRNSATEDRKTAAKIQEHAIKEE